jgi:hypothetical protein
MRTKDRMDPPRQGRVRRFFLGDQEENGKRLEHGSTLAEFGGPRHGELPSASSGVIDVRPITPPDIETVYVKVQRLETGVRLVADTMKRAYVELAEALEIVRQRLDKVASGPEVRMYVGEAMDPINRTLRELIESSEGLPMIIASASDQMVDRIREARAYIESNLAEMDRKQSEAIASESPGGTEAKVLDESHAAADHAGEEVPQEIPEVPEVLDGTPEELPEPIDGGIDSFGGDLSEMQGSIASIADGLTTIPEEIVVIEDVEILEDGHLVGAEEASAPSSFTMADVATSIPAAPFELEAVDDWDDVPAGATAEGSPEQEALPAKTRRIDPRSIWGD